MRRRRTIHRINHIPTGKDASMHKRIWAVAAATMLVAGVAVTAALAAPSHHAAGGKTF